MTLLSRFFDQDNEKWPEATEFMPHQVVLMSKILSFINTVTRQCIYTIGNHALDWEDGIGLHAILWGWQKIGLWKG